MDFSENYKKWGAIKILVLGILILLVAGTGGYFLYLDNQQKEKNKDFAFDVVRTLNEVYQSRGLDEDEDDAKEISGLESAYRGKEHILTAKNIMEHWELDKDSLRKEITNEMLSGINDLMIAAETYVNIEKNILKKEDINLLKEDIALFNVKLEEGKSDLWLAASGLILKNDGEGISLSTSQKKEIVDFIERIFEEELKKYQESGEDESFSQPHEIWAAVIIRNGLSR